MIKRGLELGKKHKKNKRELEINLLIEQRNKLIDGICMTNETFHKTIVAVVSALVSLIATNILLRLTAAVTQPFGDGRISDFLGETADNLHYCTAGLLFTAFLYFLTILLMVYSSEALF